MLMVVVLAFFISMEGLIREMDSLFLPTMQALHLRATYWIKKKGTKSMQPPQNLIHRFLICTSYIQLNKVKYNN